MLFAIYLDGTVYISELFWNFLSFIHNNRIIMGGHFFCPPIVYQQAVRVYQVYQDILTWQIKEFNINYQSILNF